jgi:hypothetical protein
VDVADNLSTYLRKRAASQFERDRERKRAFDSPSDFEAHRETVRTTFLDGLGGLPDQPEDLAPETAGVLEQPGYTVEKVVFESRPGFHVTANCYVPHGEGPHPRVLVLPGHVGDAKRSRTISAPVSNFSRYV